jgi:LmbE family N-acetylglucosaminyl deacetylase
MTATALRVLAIGAHPDPFDMAYEAGGTLAQYAALGHDVLVLSAVRTPAREGDAAAVARLLGCRHETLALDDDGAVFDDLAHVHRVVHRLRTARPDVVITHDPSAHHPEHRAVSRAVLAACLLAPVAEVLRDLPPHRIGGVFYTDAGGGEDAAGCVYVDVSATRARKVEALRLHEKRAAGAGVDSLIERELTLMRMRAFRVERDWCEIFRPALAGRAAGSHALLPVAMLPPLAP